MLVLALVGLPLVTAIANCFYFFFWRAPSISPSVRLIALDAIWELTKSGVVFFAQQLSFVFAVRSGRVICCTLLGPDSVTQFYIPVRLFTIVTQIIVLFLTPLWPAYGEAIARRDLDWVLKKR